MAQGLVGCKNRRACKYMYPQTMEVLMYRGLFTKYRRRTNKRRYIRTINSWLINSSKRSKSGRNIWRKCTETHNPKAREYPKTMCVEKPAKMSMKKTMYIQHCTAYQWASKAGVDWPFASRDVNIYKNVHESKVVTTISWSLLNVIP